MLDAIEQNQPVASLLLDPTLYSFIFFKYKCTLVDGREPSALTSTLKTRAKYAVTHGDTLALYLTSDQTLQAAFHPTGFLPQTMVKSELTYELLEIYKRDVHEIVTCNHDFKFVVIVQANEPPVWAHEFIS
jgi:hypothetical protein